MHQTAAFYSRHFGFQTTPEVVDGLIEMHAPDGGAALSDRCSLNYFSDW